MKTLKFLLLFCLFDLLIVLASSTNESSQNLTLLNSEQLDSFRNANLSRKELLEKFLGPQKKPLTFVLCMSTVYILILLCGIIGNISTCFVVINNNCMHNTTNYYLFSLAVSDVLTLLMGLPPELYSIIIEAYPWPFGQTFCIMRSFIFETTTIASVLTILTFTFERWLHICNPIYAKKFSSGFTRALKIIFFIWILSGLLALPYAFTTGVSFLKEEYPESKTCNLLTQYQDLMKTVLQLSVLFLFIVPMTLISIMYILIGITLWKSQTKHKSNSFMSDFNSSSKKASIFEERVRKAFKKRELQVCLSNKLNCEANLVDAQFNQSIDEPIPRNNSEFSVDFRHHASIHGYDRTSKDFEHISYRARQSRRDVVKMLFVVVLSFFICWAPYHCQRVMASIYSPPSSELMMNFVEYLYYISGISIYISSTINPILYNVMSKRYRTAFKNTLKMISTCSFTSKSNQAFKNSAYHSSINFNMTKNSLNRRQRMVS